MRSCHCSVVSSVPTILWPRVRIPCTPCTLYSICIVEMETLIDEWEKDENKQKEAGIGRYFFKKIRNSRYSYEVSIETPIDGMTPILTLICKRGRELEWQNNLSPTFKSPFRILSSMLYISVFVVVVVVVYMLLLLSLLLALLLLLLSQLLLLLLVLLS